MSLLPAKPFEKFEPNKRAFLTAYSQTGGIKRSGLAARCAPSCHYYWMDTDPDYVEAFAQAQAMVGDMLEEEAIRRAMEFSDTLLIFALKAHKPDKYREQSKTDVNVTVRLESSISDGMKRLEDLRGNRLRIA